VKVMPTGVQARDGGAPAASEALRRHGRRRAAFAGGAGARRSGAALMGKPTGFLEWPRHAADRATVARALADYKEVEPGRRRRDRASPRRAGGRCMDCGVPFCTRAARSATDPRVQRPRLRGAGRRRGVALDDTNNFPEFTGRLCPAPCEAACVLALNEDVPTR
jgi:glutamate synthase (NADPH/NADH) small chain